MWVFKSCFLTGAIRVIHVFPRANFCENSNTSCNICVAYRVIHGHLPSTQSRPFRKGAFSLGQHFPQRDSMGRSSHGQVIGIS